METKTKITFYGGTGEVTGSNFLIETEKQKILVDCGLFQGCDMCDDRNAESFPYNPATVPYVFVTHAHIDHIGRLPKLTREGFTGVIYSTPPTKDLAEIALSDAVGILKEESEQSGKPPLYGKEDVEKTMSLWKTIPYHETLPLGDDVSVALKDAGHILGSAMIEFSRNGKTLVFTGDLGNSPAPLLSDTESITGTEYLIMESVYGDRNHESRDMRREILEDIIEETVAKNGVLLIPAFSIERTQEILFEIEFMIERHQVPPMPVFIDSPLAIRALDVYKRYGDYFNKEVKYIIDSGNDLFSFKQLRLTRSVEESRKIYNIPNPKIIIAGSGISMGGRIIHHEEQYISDPSATVLIVGYQPPKSMGRDLLEGAKKVDIAGKKIEVRAHIAEIRGYSAHKDMDALLHFVEQGVDSLRKVFVVMGEMKSSAFLTQRIRDYLGVNAVAPRQGDFVEIDF